MIPLLRVLPLVALLACATFLGAQAPPRVIAIGDVHGDYAVLVQVLQRAGVIDAKRRWKAGKSVLVQTGDVLDRGPHSRKAMDLLIDLEKQARKAGGQVHALLGNHEVMNLMGDLRYVSDEEFASYKSIDAEALRDQVYLANADPVRKEDPAYRDAWLQGRPLGWVELLQAFSAQGKYGRWLRQHDTMVKVGDTLFLHGGISPAYAALAATDVNTRVRAALASATPESEPLLTAQDGPLWYRGLALSPESELTAHVDALLAFHGVSRLVLGHTVAPGVVLPRFGGKVILNDVGLSAVYGGPPSSLEIDGPVVSVRHRGRLIRLPASNDLTAYLQAALSVEPAESKLRSWMAQGAAWPPPGSATPPIAP